METTHNTEPIMSAPGYEKLADVLQRAYGQAAHGKGKERHQVAGEPFEEQVMQDMARRFGVGSLLGQAFKKSEESQRLAHDASVRELLGAIVYLAGAVIAKERSQLEFPSLAAHANDNAPKPCRATLDGGCVHPKTPCITGCVFHRG